ncbi:DUF3887 domain-containing protein [Aquimarina sp. I32.4]|uniref:DUF3887 domain-containing protein n=1 Tax=Aquimarina sp. I32.4 TaxID=2053903 RepID=UPI000CDF02AE|nr:DUF3887 domain-containing protein [Aquimarina sp. I32.4]
MITIRYIVLILLCSITHTTVSQDEITYKSVTKKFQQNYNAQDVDAIYDMYTTELQEATTKKGVSLFINGCYKEFGNLKSITFIEIAENIYSYSAEFDKTVLIMDLQLSTDSKISTIQFQEP